MEYHGNKEKGQQNSALQGDEWLLFHRIVSYLSFCLFQTIVSKQRYISIHLCKQNQLYYHLVPRRVFFLDQVASLGNNSQMESYKQDIIGQES